MTTVFIKLSANGEEIKGAAVENRRVPPGSIECLAFEEAVERLSGDGSRRLAITEYEPLYFTKRVDRASPLLNQALSRGAVIAATFSFFQPNSRGEDGHYFTIKVEDARLISIHRQVPDLEANGGVAQSAIESIGIEYSKIEWTHEEAGITFADDIHSQR